MVLMKNFYFAFILLLISVKGSAQCQTSSLWYVAPSCYAAVACYGDCNAYIDITTSGGTPPYTVVHPVTGNPVVYTSTTSLTGFCVGTYDIIITDGGGCTETFSVTLTGPSTPLSVIPIYTPESFPGACDGSLYPSATGGVPTYNFNISPYVADPGNVCAGDYTVCVMDANGCLACTPVTIGNSCSVDASANSVNASGPGTCDGTLNGSATGGAAPYTFNWVDCSNGISVGTTQNQSGICAGDYLLIATDDNGCLDSTLCITVTENFSSSGIINDEFSFTIYPNPVSDLLILECNFVSEFNFEIINSLGQIVYSSQQINSEKTTLSISSMGLSEGLYIVRLYAGEIISAMSLMILAE